MAAEFQRLAVGTQFSGASDTQLKAVFRAKRERGEGATVVAAHRGSELVAVPAAAKLDIFTPSAQACEDATVDADAHISTHTAVRQPREATMRKLFASMGVSCTSSDFVPLKHFSELVRPPFRCAQCLVSNLFNRDHRSPTPVQRCAIPLLLGGNDTMVCAPTGSGKTLAFLVPLFAALKAPDPAKNPRALVIAPTKELAMQIEREAFFLAKGQRWRFVQHGQRTHGKDIMCTTPARITAMMAGKHLVLDDVGFIVFDEGDKLWDDSNDNMEHVDRVLAACPEKRVISLFSATLGDKVERLARSVMTQPVRLIVSGRAVASKEIDHRLVFVGSELGKIVEVRNLLREGLKPPVLIFVQSIERTKELLDEVQSAGLRVAVMSSALSPQQRDSTVMRFRTGELWVLITTELLARGIDFKHVGTVINFDFPLSVESYVHRTGRTGRAGRHGVAITFFTEDDKPRLPLIAKLVEDAGSPVDEWMKALRRPTNDEAKRLARTAPHRMAVSTRKRMIIGEKRIERQIRASERHRTETQAQNGDDTDDDYSTE